MQVSCIVNGDGDNVVGLEHYFGGVVTAREKNDVVGDE
jgi:hypothetical protein